MWLLEPAFASLHFIVEVKGTRLTGYRDGEYEGKRGPIAPVLNTAVGATTSVYLEDVGPEGLTMPIEYLVPVPPWTVKKKVAVLSGSQKGRVFYVRKYDESQCVVSEYQDAVSFEFPTDILAVLQQTDEEGISST